MLLRPIIPPLRIFHFLFPNPNTLPSALLHFS
jgi:hypothetical protein